MNIIYMFVRRHFFGIKDISMIEQAQQDGLRLGKNCDIMGECILDPGHCWLISIGDNVTLAPRVHILAHDASTFKELGYTKIGRVTIGNNVFIGANSTILPGVSIGDQVIVGANSLVSKSVESNKVVSGNPAKEICTYDEYMAKQKVLLKSRPCYDGSYTLGGGIDEKKKQQMLTDLGDGIGFVE